MSQVATTCRWASSRQSATIYSLRRAATREYQGPITCSVIVKDLGVWIFASGPWIYWAPLRSSSLQPGSVVLQEEGVGVVGVTSDHISTLVVVPPCHCTQGDVTSTSTPLSSSPSSHTLVITLGPIVLTVDLIAILLASRELNEPTPPVCEIINWRTNPPLDNNSPTTHPLISRELQPPRVIHTSVIGTHAHSTSCASLLFVTVAGSVMLYSGGNGMCIPVVPGASCPAQGLAFAAASVELTGTSTATADRSGADLRVALFLGSYSGNVLSRFVLWRAADESPQLLPGMSDINAHQPGCAIFKVRAIQQGSRMLVATAADDRSAALWCYASDATLSHIHTLGGGGSSCTSSVTVPSSTAARAPIAPIFTGRVWDVDLVCQREEGRSDDDFTILMGAGGEDGTVHVVHLAGPAVVTTISRTENLFDTRGCRAISLNLNDDRDGGPTCEIVASGMDGNVVTNTVTFPSSSSPSSSSPSICDIHTLQHPSSTPPLNLRCLTVAEGGLPMWTVCAMDEGYNIYVCTQTYNPTEDVRSQVCMGVGAKLEGIVGKPSCLRAKWCDLVLRLFIGTDRGSLAVVDLDVPSGNPVTISNTWVLPSSLAQEGIATDGAVPPPLPSSKISALTISSSSNRVAFIESVGRRIGTFTYNSSNSSRSSSTTDDDRNIEWLPVRSGQRPGEALYVEGARIVGTSADDGDVAVYERSSHYDAWGLVASKSVSDILQLRQSTRARPRSKGAVNIDICRLLIIQVNGRDTIVVAISTGEVLYVDVPTLYIGEQMGAPANWVVVATPYACGSVVSMNMVGMTNVYNTGDVFMISTSGTVVTAGTVSRFPSHEMGAGSHVGAHKLLDLCHHMRAKRLLTSTVIASKSGCAIGVFVYSPDSRNVMIQSAALSHTKSSPHGIEGACLLNFNLPHSHTTSSALSLPRAISKSKDLHCVAQLVACGPLIGVVSGGEDGSLVVSGTLFTATTAPLSRGTPFTQILTGGTDSNILGVACGEIVIGKAVVPVIVSVGSLSTICIWGHTRNGFHLLCKQGKGAGGAVLQDDAAVPRYLAIKLLRMKNSGDGRRGEEQEGGDNTPIIVTTSSGYMLILVPRMCPITGRLIIEEKDRIYPHGTDGLPSPIFALDALSSSSTRSEVVCGDKQGRLYCTNGLSLWSGGGGGGGGMLTTLIEGSPINAVLILTTSPPHGTAQEEPATIVAVGFDTSDLLIVSGYTGSPAVVLRRLGVGFTCIRSIAFSSHLFLHCYTTIDVLCDGEIHTLSIKGPDDGPYSTSSLSTNANLIRRVVCASSVRCSSGLVVVKKINGCPISFRCVVGQGMEITCI